MKHNYTLHLICPNSLLYGLPDQSLNRLQKNLNIAARILFKISKYYRHTSETLMDPHWLPVQQRVLFKVLILTYQAYHKIAPDIYVICLFYILIFVI